MVDEKISSAQTMAEFHPRVSGGMRTANFVPRISPMSPGGNGLSSDSAYQSIVFDSRRESFNTQRASNFGDLRLAGSPYTIHNRSSIFEQGEDQAWPAPGGEYRNQASEFRRSRAPSDAQSVSSQAYSLQHRQLSELRDEGEYHVSLQPYSRTPELRISHKLAERKRRTEMKELFDALNSRQHHDRGSKASKWEILTKGKDSLLCITSALVNREQLLTKTCERQL
jgi:hypothetical protein